MPFPHNPDLMLLPRDTLCTGVPLQASTVPNPLALLNVWNNPNTRNIIIGCVAGIGGFAILIGVITIIIVRRRMYGIRNVGSPTHPDGRIPSQFTGPLAPPTPHTPGGLRSPLVGSGGSL